MQLLRRYLPILTWGAEYSRRTSTNDLIVAGIVTVMLIPQSLAYALVAGLPAQVGLYASMAALVFRERMRNQGKTQFHESRQCCERP
jgi:SulP family sulfate permease